MPWKEVRPGRWENNGHLIMKEVSLPPTLEEAILVEPVYSWKGPNTLYRDMVSFPSLEAAKTHAETTV